MPTKKPRIVVTLDQDLYDTLKQHCVLTGRSMSSFIAETMSYSTEGLKSINKLLELSATMNDDALSMLKDKLSDAESVLSHMMLTSASAEFAGVAPAACKPAEAEEQGENPLAINKGVWEKNGVYQDRSSVKKPAIFLASSSSKKGGQ